MSLVVARRFRSEHDLCMLRTRDLDAQRYEAPLHDMIRHETAAIGIRGRVQLRRATRTTLSFSRRANQIHRAVMEHHGSARRTRLACAQATVAIAHWARRVEGWMGRSLSIASRLAPLDCHSLAGRRAGGVLQRSAEWP
jgi:hypothetical protein